MPGSRAHLEECLRDEGQGADGAPSLARKERHLELPVLPDERARLTAVPDPTSRSGSESEPGARATQLSPHPYRPSDRSRHCLAQQALSPRGFRTLPSSRPFHVGGLFILRSGAFHSWDSPPWMAVIRVLGDEGDAREWIVFHRHPPASIPTTPTVKSPKGIVGRRPLRRENQAHPRNGSNRPKMRLERPASLTSRRAGALRRPLPQARRPPTCSDEHGCRDGEHERRDAPLERSPPDARSSSYVVLSILTPPSQQVTRYPA